MEWVAARVIVMCFEKAQLFQRMWGSLSSKQLIQKRPNNVPQAICELDFLLLVSTREDLGGPKGKPTSLQRTEFYIVSIGL